MVVVEELRFLVEKGVCCFLFQHGDAPNLHSFCGNFHEKDVFFLYSTFFCLRTTPAEFNSKSNVFVPEIDCYITQMMLLQLLIVLVSLGISTAWIFPKVSRPKYWSLLFTTLSHHLHGFQNRRSRSQHLIPL